MVERIVSPGVFTRENDVSFLPQGIAQIGAAIIGPTIKGPAFVPTVIESQGQFDQVFGPVDVNYYAPYTAKQYLKSAGTVTIVRVLGTAGYTITKAIELHSAGNNFCALLAPTYDYTIVDGDGDIASGSTVSAFVLTVGGTDYSCSLDPSSDKYVTNVFGEQANQGATPSLDVYVYKHFEVSNGTITTSDLVTAETGSHDIAITTAGYRCATTPWILSHEAATDSRSQLFKFHTLSHGDTANSEIKVGIRDIKNPSEIAGSDYGTFTVVVRGVYDSFESTDSDTKPDLKETFTGVNLDPNSTNYIARRIGDRYSTTDSDGKVTYHGDWNSKSAFIRVEVDNNVKDAIYSAEKVPYGFDSVLVPVIAASGSTSVIPTASFVTSQDSNTNYEKRVYFGFDFSNEDNKEYLSVLEDSAAAGSNLDFHLSDLYGHASSSYTGSLSGSSASDISEVPLDMRKFIVPFQDGFDGFDPTTPKNTGEDISTTNLMGYNLASGQSGAIAYKKAIDTVSNPDEIDINMLVLPGVTLNEHSYITEYLKSMVETRGDCFYVADCVRKGLSITDAISAVTAWDSSYVSTYWPWVRMFDAVNNKYIWVPPSVVMAGTIAFNDQVAAEWFAPAGLNRGGLTDVIEAETRLTQAERDDLYVDRVNPIATFPGQGVTVWGQKTLQAKPSALDRVNVRRLLIGVKKYIASATKYLVFEQNNSATRNRFLNIVNPYLESIQQRSGLSAFKVVMDESNNTADVIDRNQLVGAIYLQPTRTAEFIILDFNIMGSGAVFPE